MRTIDDILLLVVTIMLHEVDEANEGDNMMDGLIEVVVALLQSRNLIMYRYPTSFMTHNRS